MNEKSEISHPMKIFQKIYSVCQGIEKDYWNPNERKELYKYFHYIPTKFHPPQTLIGEWHFIDDGIQKEIVNLIEERLLIKDSTLVRDII